MQLCSPATFSFSAGAWRRCRSVRCCGHDDGEDESIAYQLGVKALKNESSGVDSVCYDSQLRRLSRSYRCIEDYYDSEVSHNKLFGVPSDNHHGRAVGGGSSCRVCAKVEKSDTYESISFLFLY